MFHTIAFALIAILTVSLVNGFKPEEVFLIRWRRIGFVVAVCIIALVIAANK